MTDLYNKLSEKKEEIEFLQLKLSQAKTDYLKLQIEGYRRYKLDLASKYMTLWDNSNKFPVDPELTNLIFFLMGDKEAKQPKIELKFNGQDFVLTYYNERLQVWLEVK